MTDRQILEEALRGYRNVLCLTLAVSAGWGAAFGLYLGMTVQTCQEDGHVPVPEPPKIVIPPAPPLPEDADPQPQPARQLRLQEAEAVLALESCPGIPGTPYDGGAYLDYRRRRFVQAARVRREALAQLNQRRA